MVQFQFIFLYSKKTIWELLDKIKDLDPKKYESLRDEPISKGVPDMIKFWSKHPNDPDILLYNVPYVDPLEDFYIDHRTSEDPFYKDFKTKILIDSFNNKTLDGDLSFKRD